MFPSVVTVCTVPMCNKCTEKDFPNILMKYIVFFSQSLILLDFYLQRLELCKDFAFESTYFWLWLKLFYASHRLSHESALITKYLVNIREDMTSNCLWPWTEPSVTCFKNRHHDSYHPWPSTSIIQVTLTTHWSLYCMWIHIREDDWQKMWQMLWEKNP